MPHRRRICVFLGLILSASALFCARAAAQDMSVDIPPALGRAALEQIFDEAYISESQQTYISHLYDAYIEAYAKQVAARQQELHDLQKQTNPYPPPKIMGEVARRWRSTWRALTPIEDEFWLDAAEKLAAEQLRAWQAAQLRRQRVFWSAFAGRPDSLEEAIDLTALLDEIDVERTDEIATLSNDEIIAVLDAYTQSYVHLCRSKAAGFSKAYESFAQELSREGVDEDLMQRINGKRDQEAVGIYMNAMMAAMPKLAHNASVQASADLVRLNARTFTELSVFLSPEQTRRFETLYWRAAYPYELYDMHTCQTRDIAQALLDEGEAGALDEDVLTALREAVQRFDDRAHRIRGAAIPALRAFTLDPKPFNNRPEDPKVAAAHQKAKRDLQRDLLEAFETLEKSLAAIREDAEQDQRWGVEQVGAFGVPGVLAWASRGFRNIL